MRLQQKNVKMYLRRLDLDVSLYEDIIMNILIEGTVQINE